MKFSVRALVALGLVCVGVVSLATPSPLYADDLDPAALIDSAKAALGEKKYGKALADLNSAIAEIMKLRVEQLKAVLPAAPAGWTADDASGEATSAALFGGGVSVKRDYHQGEEKSVSIELLSDSPMVAMTAAFLANPMMFQGQPGMSQITLKSRRALLEYQKEEKSGNVKVLLNGNTALLTITGNAVSDTDLKDTFGKALDLDAIEKALQN